MVSDPRTLVVLFLVLGGAPAALAQQASRVVDEPGAVSNAEWWVASEASRQQGGSQHEAIYNYYRQVRHDKVDQELDLEPDPYGPERMQLPTPVHGHGFDGAPKVALNTRPDTPTLGIRLDTSYGLLRDIEGGIFLSEHQFLTAAGATFLPVQTPCWILGTRLMITSVDQLSMMTNTGINNYTAGFAGDLFFGTRYKTVYMKIGSFWDYQDHFGKVGFSFGSLARLPLIGHLTLDTAFAAHTGSDLIGTDRHPQTGLNSRRVENTDLDVQIRVGHYFRPGLQIGATGNYLAYDDAFDEAGLGAFCTVKCGRLTITGDITGGNEGLRGFVMAGFSFGKAPATHPRDWRIEGVDTVEWLTRPTIRDLSVRLRQSFTGPLPLGSN